MVGPGDLSPLPWSPGSSQGSCRPGCRPLASPPARRGSRPRRRCLAAPRCISGVPPSHPGDKRGRDGTRSMAPRQEGTLGHRGGTTTGLGDNGVGPTKARWTQKETWLWGRRWLWGVGTRWWFEDHGTKGAWVWGCGKGTRGHLKDQGEVIMGQVDEVVGHGEMTTGHGDTATGVWGQGDTADAGHPWDGGCRVW